LSGQPRLNSSLQGSDFRIGDRHRGFAHSDNLEDPRCYDYREAIV